MSNYFDQDFLDNVSGATPYVSMTGVGSNSNSRHSFTDYEYDKRNTAFFRYGFCTVMEFRYLSYVYEDTE